jgi:cell division protein FtsB
LSHKNLGAQLWLVAQDTAEFSFDFTLLLQLAGFAVIVGGAAVWLLSALRKQRTDELQNLATTRGHRIEDLEAEIAELRREVAEVRGQMNALRDLKVEAMAAAVVDKLKQEGIVGVQLAK